MERKSWRRVMAVRLVSTTMAFTVSGYFLWFMMKRLEPFFAEQGTLEEEGTRLEVCVTCLGLSIVFSTYLNFQAGLNLLRTSNSEDWDESDRNRGSCHTVSLLFESLFTIAMLILTVITTVFTWRWGQALDTQGEGYLATNCNALAIYNITMLCFSLVVVPLMYAILSFARAILRHEI